MPLKTPTKEVSFLHFYEWKCLLCIHSCNASLLDALLPNRVDFLLRRIRRWYESDLLSGELFRGTAPISNPNPSFCSVRNYDRALWRCFNFIIENVSNLIKKLDSQTRLAKAKQLKCLAASPIHCAEWICMFVSVKMYSSCQIAFSIPSCWFVTAVDELMLRLCIMIKKVLSHVVIEYLSMSLFSLELFKQRRKTLAPPNK